MMRKRVKIAAFCAALIIILPLILTGCAPRAESVEDAAARLNNYKIEAAYNEKNHTVTAVETLTYENRTGEALNDLRFNLYANAYREDAQYKAVAAANRSKAYPHGASWGNIEIHYAKLDGRGAGFEVGGGDKNILILTLPEPLPPEGAVAAEISFTTTLPNSYDRLGWNDKTVLITNFYPVLCVYENGAFSEENYMSYGDPFYSDAANYLVNFTFPNTFSAAHTGDRTDSVEAGGTNTISIKADCVRDFAIALSAPKTMVTLTDGDLTVNYHYISDNSFEENLELARLAMKEFSEMFGGYPYKKIEIFETPFSGGGMEYPGLVLTASALTQTERKEVIVHELCHQWWYGLVGNNQHNSAWFDEGLTDFCTLLFFQKYPDYGIDKDVRIKQAGMNYALFADVLKSLSEKGDTTMTRRLSEYENEREYVFMTYVKGMLMFDALHKTLGEKAFLRALQRLFADNIFGVVADSGIIAAFNSATRQKLNGFFRSWLDGQVVIARLSGGG